MKLSNNPEDSLAKDLSLGLFVRGRQAAEFTLENGGIMVKIKNPITAAEMAVRGYFVAKNLKKLGARIMKASRKVTVKYGFISVKL